MNPLFRKKNNVESRIREIEAEMAALHKEMRTVKKARERPLSSAFPVYRERFAGESSAAPRVPRESPPEASDSGAARSRDDRFKNYLASSFQNSHALKHERRLQRNKAIVMLVVVGLLLFWVLWQVFHVFLS